MGVITSRTLTLRRLESFADKGAAVDANISFVTHAGSAGRLASARCGRKLGYLLVASALRRIFSQLAQLAQQLKHQKRR